jgi:hypothetical protein
MASFFFQRLRIAVGCVPAIAVFIFFTEETASFLDSILLNIPILSQNPAIPLVFSITLTFLLLLLVHKLFLRSYLFAVLYAALQTIILLSLMGCLITAIVLLRYRIHSTSIDVFYVSAALVLCGFTSFILAYWDYCNILPKYLTRAETIMERNLQNAQYERTRRAETIGFLWKDFDMGLVVQRDETRQLIDSLENQKSCFLVGDQASGKSVIARSVAYRQLLSRHIVFVIEDAEVLDADRVVQEISSFNLPNVLLIVDDVHRNPSACSELLKRLSSFDVRLLLCSRPIDPTVFREGEGLDLLNAYRRKVVAKVSNELIRGLIRNRYYSARVAVQVTDEDVADVISKCGTDLWLVTYFLMSWDPKKERIQAVGRERIYERVYESRIEQWRRIGNERINVMQIAAALYAFEIPVSERYYDRLGLASAALVAADEGNLNRKGSYYSLHHASVATIYLETLVFCGLIENDVQFCSEILSSYLHYCEPERSVVLYKLGIVLSREKYKQSTIVENILKAITVRDIVTQIEAENDILRIGLFLRNLSRIDSQLAQRVLRATSSDVLKGKVSREISNQARKDFFSDIKSIDNAYDRISWKLPVKVAVAPVFNEERMIEPLVSGLSDYVDYVLVIDDGSTDHTARKARELGARVVSSSTSKGLIESILSGIRSAVTENADLVFLLDVVSIPIKSDFARLIQPVLYDQTDLVVASSDVLRRYQMHTVQQRGWVQVMNRSAMNTVLKYAEQTRRAMNTYGVAVTAILFKKILRVMKIEYTAAYPGPILRALTHRGGFGIRRSYYVPKASS